MARTRRSFRPRRYGRSRPTDRVIRASAVELSLPDATFVAYEFVADKPCTASQFALDIGMLSATGATADSTVIAYALVFIPDGYTANNLHYPTTTNDFYEPTKNAILTGVLTDYTIEDHKRSRYSRKLSSGDRIALLSMRPSIAGMPGSATSAPYELNFTVSY